MKTNLSLYAGLAGGALIILWLVFGGRPVTEETASLSSPAVAEAETSEPADSAYRRLQKQRTQGSAFPEYFVNGRPATPEEVAQIKAQDKRVAEERRRQTEEAAYWETRQEWIANFPFEPAYHPEITYDPEVLEEKRLELDEEGLPIVELDEEGWPIEPIEDERYWEMKRLVQNHGFLKGFYENPYRYSPEFEQMHRIFDEMGINYNPIIWGKTFSELADYHQAMQHDPESPFPYPQGGDKTWGERSEFSYRGILGSILGSITWKGFPDQTPPTREQAEALRERMISEIPPEGFRELGRRYYFLYHSEETKKLKPGDPLLIR
ncbi:MAG: hypothetical protein M2R45_02707 [Verrucomicrobia subdivision 3 bacterium]|nr:hypothetical protein [Limisphaerales bacterium]MCS1415048.1 hypothetical protein [Limisphaerales bacterium]